VNYHLLQLIVLLSFTAGLSAQNHSKLWGERGELWQPSGELLSLLDFTNVGYKSGDVPIPFWPIGVNVKDFGAVGDGVHDDTEAFKKAIAACPPNSAVFVPIGRYTITDQIRVEKDAIVIRGEDMYQSVIWFPKYLTELITVDLKYLPEQLQAAAYDANGQSYAGRILYDEFKSHDKDGNPVGVKKGLTRLMRGQHPKNSGFFHFSNGSEQGIENLAFEFREQPKGGHWETIGADAIRYVRAKDSWIRNVYIKNSDHAIRLSNSQNVSVINIVLDQYILRNGGGSAVGHMGIALSDSKYCLVHNIELTGMWIHDIVTNGADAHNVYSRISGTDLKLDHHSRGGQWQLHTEIDFGKGTRPFSSSQNDTYWGLSSIYPISYLEVGREGKTDTPRPNVVVGMHTEDASSSSDGYWHETIDPNAMVPRNLYLAQMMLKGKPLPHGPHPKMPPPPPGSLLQFTPEADAMLRGGGFANENYGGASGLFVKPAGGDYLREAILRFNLSELGDMRIEKATLRLFTASSRGSLSLAIQAIDDDIWSEYAITRGDCPAPGEVVATVAADIPEQWIEVDLTDLVNQQLQGNRKVSLLLSGTESKGGEANFNSSENRNPPILSLRPAM
jgi:hypothetical protein